MRHNANVRLGWFYEKSCELLYCVTSLLLSADSWCACVGWWGNTEDDLRLQSTVENLGQTVLVANFGTRQ